MSLSVLIIHNRLSDNPTEDEKDVVAQIGAIRDSLVRLGRRTDTLPLSLDLQEGRELIAQKSPVCIFNLVESLDGDDRFISAAPLLYESLHIPYTGSSPAALAATSDKSVAKRIMHAAGIPTPRWEMITDSGIPPGFFPFIIKSSTDHASIGITDDSVIAGPHEWQRWIGNRTAPRRKGLFAESYIHGREFNLSLLESAGEGVLVLPPAEISFAAFPEGKPHIVGYAAKWNADAFEYHHTPRQFSHDPRDESLRARLIATARSCWDLFSLSGYARVDFRVDAGGNLFVLEVNANPCLSPDAGFVAACEQEAINYDAIVERLVAVALEK